MKYLVEPQNIMTKEDCNIFCPCLGFFGIPCNANCSSNCISNCPGRCYRAVPYNKLEDE